MASNSSADSNPSQQAYIVRASEPLRTLISTVKQLNPITTSRDVLDGLKMYIMRKKLFSSLDPCQIMCPGDELSTVFGTDKFTISDVGRLLQRHLLPVRINLNNSGRTVQAAATACNIAAKRKAEESVEGDSIKKSKDPMYLYLPPSPKKEDCSSDTADSIQGYETAFVKDSTDDYLSSCCDENENLHPGDILAIEETFDVEYEIASDTDDEIKITLSDSDSDAVDIFDHVLSFICKSDDSDEQFWADKSSDENYDSDAEIQESDKWRCKCGNLNNPPMGVCSKCWHMRSGWIVPKRSESERRTPRKKRYRRKNKSHKSLTKFKKDSSSPKPATSSSSGSAPEMPNSILSRNINKASKSEVSLQTPDISSDVSSFDLPSNSFPTKSFRDIPSCSTSGVQKVLNSFSDISSSSQELSTLSSCSSSQEFPSTSSYSSSQELPSTSSYSRSQELPSTSYKSRKHLNSSKDVVSPLNDFQTLNLSTVKKCEADAKLCIICYEKPANASLIHGKYAHQFSCYGCAKKISLNYKKCPLCRRTIDRVVHQITSFS